MRPAVANAAGNGNVAGTLAAGRTAGCQTAGFLPSCAGLNLDPFNPDLKLAYHPATVPQRANPFTFLPSVPLPQASSWTLQPGSQAGAASRRCSAIFSHLPATSLLHRPEAGPVQPGPEAGTASRQ